MKVSGKIIDLHNREVYAGEVLFENGIIEKVNRTDKAPEVFIMPGLVDAHVHIESSMVTPSHFAVAAVKHGTVAVVSDPHEIANVMGTEGVKFMYRDAQNVPVKFCFGAPSCVPATSFESSGAAIGPKQINELFENGYVSYLAEMMNFPGVIYEQEDVLQKIQIARERNVVIDGHAPGLMGDKLKKYIAAGISTDHECSSLEEAKEKASLGMKILIREGSAAKNLTALAEMINFLPGMVMLCSDDLHPEMLEKGHINRLVARLINIGYDMFDVIRAATVNPSLHYNLNVGQLKPGDPADFIVIDNPQNMSVLSTFIDGKCVYDGKDTLFTSAKIDRINNFICNRISEKEIEVRNNGTKMRVIVAQNGELLTSMEYVSSGNEPFIIPSVGKDILKIIVKERYHDSPPAMAFIKGFGLKSGAFATSVAHDSHNIIAVGTTDRDIVQAVNMIVDANGGMSVVSDNESLILKLPVAGIMSDMPVSAMAQSYERLSEIVKSQGCLMDAPFMTLSFMALLVIPELKLSDKGLFDGKQFAFVPLFID